MLEVATSLSEHMGGQVPLAMIALDPQVLEYGRALLDKKENLGPSKISLRQILADVLEGAGEDPKLLIEDAEPFPMVKLIRDGSGANDGDKANDAGQWESAPRQRERSEQGSERHGRAWSDRGSERHEMSDRSMSRPRLYKDTPGPPAAWQKRRAVSLPRSQPEREGHQGWDSGSQHSWRERSNSDWTWKTGGWDNQSDSQDWNYSVTGLMGRWTKTVGADWGWDRQRGDWRRDSGYNSWGAAHNAGEASGQKRKLDPYNEEAAGAGAVLQVVDGVPVVSLERGSDMDSNAAPLLQAALENHARAESLYEQCDSLPEAREIAHAARRKGIVKKVADIGIARARSTEHPDCFAAGLQGKRSIMFALALALCSRDSVCLRRCLKFLQPLQLVDSFSRLMTESGLLNPEELKSASR